MLWCRPWEIEQQRQQHRCEPSGACAEIWPRCNPGAVVTAEAPILWSKPRHV